MSDIWIPYGGGGGDLDQVTATDADVRKGKTIVDKDGNPIGGTMPDIAGRTITPTTSQQTLNGGGYLTGNVVVPGFTMPPANVIKKGYVLNVFGIKITGSFEGWVAGNGELYRYGDNAAGFSCGSSYVVFESGQISFNCDNSHLSANISSAQAYNSGPWSYINVLFNRVTSIGSGQGFMPVASIAGHSINFEGYSSDTNAALNFYGEQNVRFPLNGLSVTGTLGVNTYRFRGSIKRIYFS